MRLEKPVYVSICGGSIFPAWSTMLPCVCSPAGIEELHFGGAGSKYRHTPGPGLLLPTKPGQGEDASDLAYENHQSNLNHLRSHFVHKTLSVSIGTIVLFLGLGNATQF